MADSERQLSAQPDGLDSRAKKNKVGALPAEDLVAAHRRARVKARADLDKADDKILAEAKTESFDHSQHVKGGNNMSKPETWTLSIDGGELGPQTKSLKDWADEDPEFKKCLTKLTACYVDGKNYATKDTLQKAVDAYNDAHPFSKVTVIINDNRQGGIDFTFKGSSQSQVKAVLEKWSEVSLAEIPKTKNVSDVSRSPVPGLGS